MTKYWQVVGDDYDRKPYARFKTKEAAKLYRGRAKLVDPHVDFKIEKVVIEDEVVPDIYPIYRIIVEWFDAATWDEGPVATTSFLNNPMFQDNKDRIKHGERRVEFKKVKQWSWMKDEDVRATIGPHLQVSVYGDFPANWVYDTSTYPYRHVQTRYPGLYQPTDKGLRASLTASGTNPDSVEDLAYREYKKIIAEYWYDTNVETMIHGEVFTDGR